MCLAGVFTCDERKEKVRGFALFQLQPLKLPLPPLPPILFYFIFALETDFLCVVLTVLELAL